ncbi:MAG: hypothetical protein NVSMB65_02330 [Chloroflexota bacterium]
MITARSDGDFVWRDIPRCAARVEHPRLRQPLSLIVDDPTPGYNPAYFHSGFRNGPPLVPREMGERFADLVEARGIRGKFSVIPYPFGLGSVDGPITGIAAADVRYFVDLVRTRISPHLDVTPEALTHWNALDLSTGQLLPLWEHVWSRQQTRHTLPPYLARGLEILNAVNLPCEGVTSPWDFGAGVETEYAEAILAAQQQVHGRSFSWYYLHGDITSRHVPPRLPVFRPQAGEAVVSIVSCDDHDFGAAVWSGGQPDPDKLISEDGGRGRLAAVLAAGGPAVFHTHWQTLFSQGTESGMRALGLVAQRVKDHFCHRVAWTGCSDLARYAAAAGAVDVRRRGGDGQGTVLSVEAPFATAQFTLSLPCPRPVRSLRVDGRPLAPVATRGALGDDTYLVEGERLVLCWNLAGHQEITVDCD